MKILFIYKSEPDDITKVLKDKVGEGNHVTEFNLFEKDPDYHKLLDLIFDSDKVITWW